MHSSSHSSIIYSDQDTDGKGNGNALQFSCLENLHGQKEPGGLQPMGSQRVGCEWSNLARTQDTESTQVSINRSMDKEDMI